jgi:hypothetical protein
MARHRPRSIGRKPAEPHDQKSSVTTPPQNHDCGRVKLDQGERVSGGTDNAPPRTSAAAENLVDAGARTNFRAVERRSGYVDWQNPALPFPNASLGGVSDRSAEMLERGSHESWCMSHAHTPQLQHVGRHFFQPRLTLVMAACFALLPAISITSWLLDQEKRVSPSPHPAHLTTSMATSGSDLPASSALGVGSVSSSLVKFDARSQDPASVASGFGADPRVFNLLAAGDDKAPDATSLSSLRDSKAVDLGGASVDAAPSPVLEPGIPLSSPTISEATDPPWASEVKNRTKGPETRSISSQIAAVPEPDLQIMPRSRDITEGIVRPDDGPARKQFKVLQGGRKQPYLPRVLGPTPAQLVNSQARLLLPRQLSRSDGLW